MKTSAQVLSMFAVALALAGCGGGGGGGSGDGGVAPPANAFTAAVQNAVSASSEDDEPAELTVDSGGDAGADDEPLVL